MATTILAKSIKPRYLGVYGVLRTPEFSSLRDTLADLSTETRDFLTQMETKLQAELEAIDRQAEENRRLIQAKLEDIHTAMSAVNRVLGGDASRFVVTTRRRGRPARSTSESEWHDKLAGLNQREAVIKIAETYGHRLDVPYAAKILREAGKLQGKFADDAGAAETRTAWLARGSSRFKEIDNRHFELVTP